MGTMLIVVIMFSLFGIILIHENFKNSYQLQMKINYNEHILEKYSIETNINDNLLADGTVNLTELENYLYTLTSYLGNSRKLSIVLNNDSIWNNVPFKLNYKECKTSCIKSYDSQKYSILKSTISINKENIEIISIYDISDIFAVRDQNLLKFYIIDAVLIVLCGCLTTIFARFLTKPIKKLNETTKLVAEGNLDIKIDVKGNDEIGELSKSFVKMIDSIKKRQNELELSVKQREDFISNFTHELKTPMTSIMGYTKVLKKDKYSKEDKEKALDYIYSETKRLETLSHKLLDLASLSEDKIILSNINTTDFFKEIKEIASKRFQDIHINLDVKEETILGDKELLTTCIMNLIENGYKASDKEKNIEIIGKSFKDKYRITIIDNGIGIKKDEIDRITEDFYTIDRSRSKKTGSYGLGLGIVSKILALHHAKLNFKSELCKGTKVSFDLEMAENEEK
jgi:signal transduction histidine kinase